MYNAPAQPVLASTSPATQLEYIKGRIRHYAEFYGVSEVEMYNMVKAESNFDPDIDGDNGTSHGLVQIHITKNCHTNITEAQAHDINFALDFLASNLKAGRCYLWSTCPKV